MDSCTVAAWMMGVLCQSMVVVLVLVQQWLVCWVEVLGLVGVVDVAHAYVVLMVNVLVHQLLLLLLLQVYKGGCWCCCCPCQWRHALSPPPGALPIPPWQPTCSPI